LIHIFADADFVFFDYRVRRQITLMPAIPLLIRYNISMPPFQISSPPFRSLMRYAAADAAITPHISLRRPRCRYYLRR
jgi:predicted anti-sigma-YlaC factor YlaD